MARGWRELYRRLQREGSLDSYLAGVCLSREAIATGLQDGSVVEDLRLAYWFARMGPFRLTEHAAPAADLAYKPPT